MTSTLAHLFTPHHTNNYRARILHPAGLTVLVAVFLLAQTWVRLLEYAPTLPGGLVLGYASDITASQTVDDTNNERAKLGLAPLHVSAVLNQAAVAKANHMFAQNYWAHIAPDGTTPWVFIKDAGYNYSVAGENLARDFDTTGAMVQAWMDSPTHKENIVNNKYTEIGVAVVNGTLEGVETTLVVQMFGKPATGLAQTSNTGASDQIDMILEPADEQTMPVGAPAAVLGEDLGNPELAQNPVDVSALGVSLTAPNSRSSAESMILSPLVITKAVSAAIVILMLFVLLFDLIVMKQKKLPRRVGKNWAHITILALLLLFVMVVAQGKVL